MQLNMRTRISTTFGQWHGLLKNRIMQRHALIVLYGPYRTLGFTEDSCMDPVEGYPIGMFPLPYLPSCTHPLFSNFQLLYARRWLDPFDINCFFSRLSFLIPAGLTSQASKRSNSTESSQVFHLRMSITLLFGCQVQCPEENR